MRVVYIFIYLFFTLGTTLQCRIVLVQCPVRWSPSRSAREKENRNKRRYRIIDETIKHSKNILNVQKYISKLKL